jgi:hypothetical protein
MATELEVFSPYDRPPSLSQLRAGIERMCGVKAVTEKKKEESETEWTWAHFFQASSPDTGGFSIERTVVNRKARETLEKLKAPLEFIRGINWCYTLSAPEGTEPKELEMMYAAAGVLAKFARGKVYDPQEEAVLEADELAGSVAALAKPKGPLLDGPPAGGAAPGAALAAKPPVPWLSIVVALGVLAIAGYVVYWVLSNILLILVVGGGLFGLYVAWQVWKREQARDAAPRKAPPAPRRK